MFVTAAHAQAAGAPSGAASIASFLPLVLIFVIMYFLMIRPQQKRMKEHRALIEALKKGDEVVTQGGLVGKITSIRDNELEVEIAPGVKVRVIRSTITGLVNRTQPAAANN
ncbi:preprotein translocase subunit YajC [Paracoccus sp. TOH]|uniref:Sec translocon accessory complex subunit YajC n=1 Tax=Paracoccus simplex TaxID=2086346 RepID=A0ABV7RWP0_9RHOB|nr:preprotein translocase subunit YajC [Paracoccus sp. TOH]WJS85835.1 preprotein translocase subunit YajC [Paracoccus sp. TOH]